jgi:CheY-like chemotaxis protein
VVDDEQSLLDGIRRVHRKSYEIKVACGARAGLDALEQDGPFAVVICDYQMPDMNGAEFLEQAQELSPSTVRLMLSGNADLDAAIEVVNQGHIFRFLTKPCPPQTFRTAVDAGLEQYALHEAERLLLEETVRGSIEVLVEVLALSSPETFGRSSRVRHYVGQVAAGLGLADSWRFETAALLSQIGHIAVPPDILHRRSHGEPLSAHAERMLGRHASVARDLLCKIPRLEEVAEIVAHQGLRADDPALGLVPRTVRVGAIALSAALAFDELVVGGRSPESAVSSLARDPGRFDPRVLKLLGTAKLPGQERIVQRMSVRELHVGMIIDEDVYASSGTLIVARGNVISVSMLERLGSSADSGAISPSVQVRVTPVEDADAA